MEQTDLLLQKSFANPAHRPSLTQSRSTELFKNKPSHSDKNSLKIRSKSKNSALAKRKAYDKLRKYGAENYYEKEQDLGFVSGESRPNSTDASNRNTKTIKTVKFELEKEAELAQKRNEELFNNTNDLLDKWHEQKNSSQDRLEPLATTPRTANLLEILGNQTPTKPVELASPIKHIQAVAPVSLTQSTQAANLSDIAAVGKAIGESIVEGITKSENYKNLAEPVRELQIENMDALRRFNNINLPTAHAESSTTMTPSDYKKFTPQLHYKNPIRVNRISKPVKTESEKLKQQLQQIINAKQNLDQNFKYLEDDLDRNEKITTKEQEIVSKMMSSVRNEVGKMSTADINQLTGVSKTSPKKGVTRANIAPMPSGAKGFSKQLRQKDQQAGDAQQKSKKSSLLEYINENFVPKNQVKNFLQEVQIPHPQPQTNQVHQPPVQEITTPQSKPQEQESWKYIPRAQPLDDPILVEEKYQRKVIHEEKPPVKLTTQTFTTVNLTSSIQEKAKQKKEKRKISDQPPTIEISGSKVSTIDPNQIIQEQTIDEVYKTAMSFVEREVTAAITERLVKSYLEANDLLKNRYRSADLENILDQELRNLVGDLIKEQNEETARKLLEAQQQSTIADPNLSDESKLISTPIATPTPSPPKSPIASTRHSIASFRQSLNVDTILEEEKEDSPQTSVKEIPDFELMSIAVNENDFENSRLESENIQTAQMPPDLKSSVDFLQPIPSARKASEKGVSSESEEADRPVTEKQSVKETAYSVSLLSNDEKSEPTFTPLSTETQISDTISYGQLLIEPGELKFNKNAQNTIDKAILPKIYENEEPGEVDKHGQLIGMYNTQRAGSFGKNYPDMSASANGLNQVQAIPRQKEKDQRSPVKPNFLKQFSLDTINDEHTSFPADFDDNDDSREEMTPVKINSSYSETGNSPKIKSNLVRENRFESSISEGQIVFNQDKFKKWRETTSLKLDSGSSVGLSSDR